MDRGWGGRGSINHHRRAGGEGSRTMTFNSRKPKHLFYKIVLLLKIRERHSSEVSLCVTLKSVDNKIIIKKECG